MRSQDFQAEATDLPLTFMRLGDCHRVYSSLEEVRPLARDRFFENGGYAKVSRRELRMVWPAEWRVFVYAGGGLPMEAMKR